MIEVESVDYGDIIIISINGEFYIESVEYAEKVWNEYAAKKPRVIGINCKNIKFIDSSAIGVLVKFLNNAMRLNIDLIFFDLSETILNIFRTAKLGNFFKIMTKFEFEQAYLQ